MLAGMPNGPNSRLEKLMIAKDYWNNYMNCYDSINLFEEYNTYLEETLKRLGDVRNMRILDAGSGTGNLSIKLRKAGARVVSIDFSKEAIRQHLQKDPQASVRQLSLEESLPFPDNSFDVVVCMSVLFALSAPGRKLALAEFHRVLGPGGLLLVTAKKPGKSNLKHLGRHLSSRWQKLAPTAFVREMFSTSGKMVKMIYYNRLLRSMKKRDAYCKLPAAEIVKVIKEAGFSNTQTSTAFSGFFNLVQAIKGDWRVTQYNIEQPITRLVSSVSPPKSSS
jgi:ubiquinone/menaquinone biosynthesis C-methylase UbiE